MPMKLSSMYLPIRLPDLGVEPVTLSTWYAKEGEAIYEGESVVEVAIEGVTFDVAAPATGRLVHISAFSNDRVRTGQLLGVVETE